MCYKGKCLFCIPVENGCLVFAILSAIANLLVLLALLIAEVLFLVGSDAYYDPLTNSDSARVFQGLINMAVSVAYVILGIPFLIAYVFSVLLCKGIRKRKPGIVKAYFIYGVFVMLLAVFAAISHVALNNDNPYPGVYVLIACGIYGLILWMVHETYTKISAMAIQRRGLP
ncbi:uncharacterized protein [Choristoneura fumiferana]|uniref:uncharacterized protein n=1 Tax=Choristoneura fumiferana TaxID=7141 RepID=UPI003D1598DC